MNYRNEVGNSIKTASVILGEFQLFLKDFPTSFRDEIGNIIRPDHFQICLWKTININGYDSYIITVRKRSKSIVDSKGKKQPMSLLITIERDFNPFGDPDSIAVEEINNYSYDDGYNIIEKMVLDHYNKKSFSNKIEGMKINEKKKLKDELVDLLQNHCSNVQIAEVCKILGHPITEEGYI